MAFQGPRARDLVEKTLHVDLPDLAEYSHFATNYAGFPVRVVRASSTGEEGYEIWVDAKGMPGVWGAACGQTPSYDALSCGTEALESLRIEAGIPRYGPDFGEDTLPLEAGLLNALSFNKGCYIGQEIVERARSRGHLNWKLVGLVVEASRAAGARREIARRGKRNRRDHERLRFAHAGKNPRARLRAQRSLRSRHPARACLRRRGGNRAAPFC